MCTLVVLYRPDHAWPMICAANRDEQIDRPWLPPARHWPERPYIVAGLDQLAGGSWFGLNNSGVVSGIMNRRGTLGPLPGMRSRGELVLDALDHTDAASAAHALAGRDPRLYRAFNLVIADNRCAYWLRHQGAETTGRIELMELPPGMSMFTERDRNDPDSPRIRAYLPRFRAAAAPDPKAGDWSAWATLLASRQFDPADGPIGAMSVNTGREFGTVCSSLLALPACPETGTSPRWRFAAGPPDQTPFEDVDLKG